MHACSRHFPSTMNMPASQNNCWGYYHEAIRWPTRVNPWWREWPGSKNCSALSSHCLAGEQCNVEPLHNSMKNLRLAYSHNKENIHYCWRAVLIKNGMGILFRPVNMAYSITFLLVVRLAQISPAYSEKRHEDARTLLRWMDSFTSWQITLGEKISQHPFDWVTNI
jgi:hypothetical protein